MKIFRIILLIVTGMMLVWQILFMNIIGAIAMTQEGYPEPGYGLIFAILPMLAAYILTFPKKTILPAILDVIGSAGYIHGLNALYSLSENEQGYIPHWYIDELAQNHIPSVVVTIFIIFLCGINYLLPESLAKRKAKRAKKLAEDRPLTTDERIL